MTSFPATIEQVMAKWNVPGLALAIYNDETINTSQFGVASQETGEPVTASTVFGVGSISKVFTATLAMRLVDANMLDLDGTVLGVFPQLALSNSDALRTVTMRQILTHTSGIEGDGFVDHGNHNDALPNFVATFGELSQVTSPGTAWSYSNNAMCLAGAVLAAICETTYEEAMQIHVLDPLGLTRTDFGQPPVMDGTATGYDFDTQGIPQANPAGSTTRSANPAGGVVSCVTDLITFAQAHLGLPGDASESFLTPESRAEMQRTQATVSSKEEWGIGWGKILEGGSWMIEHGGWMSGYRAQLTMIPDQSAAFAILNNGPLGHAAIQDIQKIILKETFGIHDEPSAPVALPQGVLDAYVGQYAQSHMDVRILLAENQKSLVLSLKTKWHGAENDAPLVSPLIPVNNNEFTIDGGEFDGSRIVFILDESGAVKFLRILHRLAHPV